MAGLEKVVSLQEESEQEVSGPQTPGTDTTTVIVPEEQRSEKEAELSDKELPEPIRPAKKMPGLPPIGIRQVQNMLCNPKMPEQKIMKLVASKLNSAYDSDDAGSEGGSMRGLFDCIIETTLYQSDQSDDDSADEENSPRELPCAFCNRIFISNVRLKTHMLVMHSRQDPSLLNVAKGPQRLQRSLSHGKTGNTDASSDNKARPLLHGMLNVDVPQIEDAALVKHLPPKQRVKLSPKTRGLSKDRADPLQGENPLGIPSDTSVQSDLTKPKAAQPGKPVNANIISSPEDSSEGLVSVLENPEDPTSGSCQPSAQEAKSGPQSPKMTRSRRRSSALSAAEQPTASLPSPSSPPLPSGGRATRSKLPQSKLSPSSAAQKRKSTDSPSASSTAAKKPKNTAGTSGSGQRRSASSRRSR